MAKLAVVGQDTSKLIDCSEAVPIPPPAVGKPATFPAGTGPQLLQLSCNAPFPSLATDRELSQHNIAVYEDIYSFITKLVLQLRSPSVPMVTQTSVIALRDQQPGEVPNTYF